MREREMRQRIERFLQSRLRKMLAPATIGLGLAMTGCPSDGSDTIDDGGALVQKDGEADHSAVTKYMGPMPADASPEVPAVVAEYMAPMPDSGPVLRYMAQMPDASPDLGRSVAVYMAQLPAPRS